MLLQIFELIIFLIICPFLIGALFVRRMKKDNNSILLCYVVGMAAILAVFQVIALILIFLTASLTMLATSWSIIISILAVLSLVLNRTYLLNMLKSAKASLNTCSLITILAILLIVVQCYIYVRYQSINDDDAFYVASAATAVETDTLFQYDPYSGEFLSDTPWYSQSRYVLSPFPMFTAVLSKLTGIQSTILAHTFLPPFYLLFAYAVYALWGRKLFEKRNIKHGPELFLLFISIIHIYGSFNTRMPANYMLVRIWQGKAVLASILIPAILYAGMRAMSDDGSLSEWLFLLFLLGASALVSSMGILLAPAALMLLTLVLLWHRRSLKECIKAALVCSPCIICAVIYLFIR